MNQSCIELQITVADSLEPYSMTITVPENFSVYDLKRTILMANGSKPFFLEHNVSNCTLLKDFLAIIAKRHHNKLPETQNEIKIYTDMDTFNLSLHNSHKSQEFQSINV